MGRASRKIIIYEHYPPTQLSGEGKSRGGFMNEKFSSFPTRRRERTDSLLRSPPSLSFLALLGHMTPSGEQGGENNFSFTSLVSGSGREKL